MLVLAFHRGCLGELRPEIRVWPELARVVIASDLLRESFPVIPPDASLTEALERFSQHDGERLPVVASANNNNLVGTVSKTDVILALAGSTTRSATMVAAPAS